MLAPWKKSYEKSRQHIKKQRHHFADKGPYSQCYGFSSSHVWMWDLDHKEGRVPKNWCFQVVVLKTTLEIPLDCKEIKPDNPKGNKSWIFIGRADAEDEAPILWPPDVKSWLTGKDWYWNRLKERGEGGDRGWDGWMASSTQWTWVWANSRRWWKTEAWRAVVHGGVESDTVGPLNNNNGQHTKKKCLASLVAQW